MEGGGDICGEEVRRSQRGATKKITDDLPAVHRVSLETHTRVSKLQPPVAATVGVPAATEDQEKHDNEEQ